MQQCATSCPDGMRMHESSMTVSVNFHFAAEDLLSSSREKVGPGTAWTCWSWAVPFSRPWFRCPTDMAILWSPGAYLSCHPWASMSQWNTCLAPDHIDFDIRRHLDAFEYVWILFSLESHFNSRAEGPTAKGAPPNTGVESLSNLRVIRIVRITRLVRLTRIAQITRCLAPGRLWGFLCCPSFAPNCLRTEQFLSCLEKNRVKVQSNSSGFWEGIEEQEGSYDKLWICDNWSGWMDGWMDGRMDGWMDGYSR